MSAAVPPFPGATGLTHLRVYDSEAPDGLRGGTPHVHLCSTEAYVVQQGRGRVQTLGPGGFREIPLEPGAIVWFTPGIIHRLINDDGALELLVIMQNAGLPEAGDMVITFPPEVLADPHAYAEAAILPPGETTTAGSGEAARLRRNRAVEAFLSLRAEVQDKGPDRLATFYDAATALVQARIPEWQVIHARGPMAVVQETERQLKALGAGDGSHLRTASVHLHSAPDAPRLMGCCGTLGVYHHDRG